MDYVQAVRQLERSEPAPIYLVCGSEAYLVRAFIDRLRALAGDPALNVQAFEAGEHSLREVLEAAHQLPMFGPRRVVIVRADAWFGGGRGTLGDDEVAALSAYAADPVPTTSLVFVCAQPDRRLGVVKTLEKAAQVVRCEPPSPREAPEWVIRRAAEQGRRITRGAAQLLVALVGNDLSRLEVELAKVLAFAGDDAADESHVRAVASAAGATRIFDLLDAVAERRVGDALRELPLLLGAGEPPLRVLAMLTRQVRTLLQVRLLAERGFGADELQQRLRLHPYVIKKSLQQSQKWDPRDLVQALLACVEAETDIKTGRKNDEAALDLLVTRLAARQLAWLRPRSR